MSYSTIGILAIIIHLIINEDVLWGKADRSFHALREYRRFLIGVLAYYVTDVIWGYLDGWHLVGALIADTASYFIAMGVAVLLWTQYVIKYLADESAGLGRALFYMGRVFFGIELVLVILNFAIPVLFWFEQDGTYHAALGRYFTLGVQILMFFLTAVYTFWTTVKKEGMARRRYRTIGYFGVAMTVLISVQVFYPLLPLYAMGYMIGVCLLKTFVVEDERDEYRRELEELLERERQQRVELGSARRMAYTDPLTGVKSKNAYLEAEALMDAHVADGSAGDFAVVIFDLNGLKHINDTQGHETGDRYIVSACKLICKEFEHSPVFRVGGDEFVALLEGEDYEHRNELLSDFNERIEQNLRDGEVVVATGMAEHHRDDDSDCHEVFVHADERMYARKHELKNMGAVTRE